MNDNKKNLILSIKLFSIVVVLLVFLLTLFIIENGSEKYLEDNINNSIVKVLSTYDDFILVKDIYDNLKYTIYTDKYFSSGDLLYVTYYKDIEEPESIDVFISGEDAKNQNIINDIEKSVEEDTTTIVSTTVNKEVVDTTTTTTTKVDFIKNDNIDDIVIGYVENAKTAIDTYALNDSNKEKAKNTFVTIVDFIFYNGEIKGHTFNELSSSAKAKVIYYALLIDNKIDNKWPGYKDSISNKYEDIKAKLIAKYLDLVEYVRVNEPSVYEEIKSDFSLLKKSVGITWDIVKGAFKYAGSATISYLKNWYETFRG